LTAASYDINIPSLFNPFLTSVGRVTDQISDPSGSKAFLMEVSVFAKKDTATNQTVLSTFSFYCVFPRIPRWTNIRPPTVNRFLFVTGLLQGLSVINNKKCPCILIVDFSSSPTSPSGPVTGPSSTLPETPNSLIGVSSKLAISAHRSPLRKSPAFYLQLLLWRLFLGLLCLPLRHLLRIKALAAKVRNGGTISTLSSTLI